MRTAAGQTPSYALRGLKAALAAFVFLVLLATPVLATTPPASVVPFADLPGFKLVTVAPRAEGSQSFLVIDAPDAKATVILLTGGNGYVGLNPLGISSAAVGNFLLRTRDYYRARRLRVAIADAPTDFLALGNYRNTPEHVQDLGAMIAYLRQRYRDPVWLVGTSRGTISAANVAATLTGNAGPDGVVFTATLLADPGSDVFTFNLAAISVPTLVVHHELDSCAVTLFSDIPAFMAALTNAEDLTLQTYTGGGPLLSIPCEAFHYHGFIGIEGQVVSGIADYILERRHHGHGHGRWWH